MLVFAGGRGGICPASISALARGLAMDTVLLLIFLGEKRKNGKHLRWEGDDTEIQGPWRDDAKAAFGDDHGPRQENIIPSLSQGLFVGGPDVGYVDGRCGRAAEKLHYRSG